MRTPDFQVRTERVDGRLIISPSGELDIATVELVRSAIAKRQPDEALVLDLGQLAFLDTSGLQLMVAVDRRARDERFDLAVVRGPRNVQRVFEIAGLDGVLPFTDSRPG